MTLAAGVILPPLLSGAPPPPQFTVNSESLAVSPDGTIVIGDSYYGDHTHPSGPHAFHWTAGTGMVDLGTLPGHTQSGASLISADGTTIAGVSLGGTAGTSIHGVVWTAGGGMIDLGALYSPPFTTIPMAISSDGSVVMGWGGLAFFRWTAGGGIVNISTITGNSGIDGSRPVAGMSADGSVINESYETVEGGANVVYASAWTSGTNERSIDSNVPSSFQDTSNQLSANGSIGFGVSKIITGHPGPGPAANLIGWTGLPNLPVQTVIGNPLSSTLEATIFPYGISSDGSVVECDVGAPGGVTNVYVWTAATGFVNVGNFGGTGNTLSYGGATNFVPVYLRSSVSSDGSTVVGESTSPGGSPAFAWTRSRGIFGIGNLGNTGGDGIANGVSSDGSAIVGSAHIADNVHIHAFRWTAAGGMVDLGTLPVT